MHNWCSQLSYLYFKCLILWENTETVVFKYQTYILHIYREMAQHG